MSKQLFANAASSLLAASIGDTDLTIQVAGGFGALFPNPGAGEYFLVALQNAAGDFEVVKIESRATDLLTVASGGRGQEGTSAASWTNGQTIVEVRESKGTFEKFIQRDGDAMSGDLDMDSNELKDARLTGTTVVVGGKLVGTSIRGAELDASNEITVPSDGSRAQAGGLDILVEGDDAILRAAVFAEGMVIQWFGAAIDCPDGWSICDGTGGTPDMRDRFVVGAGSSYAVGNTGGSATASGSTAAAGGHDHGAATGGHVLTEDEMPSHVHTGANFTGSVKDNGEVGPYIETANAESYAASAPSFAFSAAGGDEAHAHTITAEGNHTHSLAAVPTLPPYKALYFIMFTG